MPKRGTAISGIGRTVPRTARASGAPSAATDGASTGSQFPSGPTCWAGSFVSRPPTNGVFEPGRAFASWLAGVRAGPSIPRAARYPISNVPQWVRQTGEYQGAFATLVGGRLDGDRLDAVAVGDCCLFHLPAGQATGAAPTPFPLADPRQFGTSPMLVPSISSGDKNLLGSLAHLSIRTGIRTG